MLFDANFFTGCPTFQHYARRSKTRQSLGTGLSVFAEMALSTGMLKVPKGDFMTQSGMSERTLNYYGGMKGISYILRKSFIEGRAGMTTAQVEGLGKIGIGAIECGVRAGQYFSYNDAMNRLNQNLNLAVRRAGWPAGHFVMAEAKADSKRGDTLPLNLFLANGSTQPYVPGLPDFEINDWEEAR